MKVRMLHKELESSFVASPIETQTDQRSRIDANGRETAALIRVIRGNSLDEAKPLKVQRRSFAGAMQREPAPMTLVNSAPT